MYRSIYIVLLTSFPLAAATIDVSVTTSSGKPAEHAVVYALPQQPMPLANKLATMDQINRAFVPHVLPIQTGAWVEFPNSDQVVHSVFSVSPAKKFQSPLYVGKPARPIHFPIAGIVHVGCTIHEQMSAYIVIVDTPYFATAVNGRAVMQDVADGQYTVKIWHPGMTSEPTAQSVTITGGQNASLSFTSGK